MARKKEPKMLTLQFVPYVEIERLSSEERVKKLLKVVKEEKIILLEGKLRAQEEADLIQRTMEVVDEKFPGIEISPIKVEKKNLGLKDTIIDFLLGDRKGLTIVGPASIVKEIKQDPDKIQLLMEERRK